MTEIDISVPLSAEAHRWPGSVGFRSHRVLDQGAGDAVTNSVMTMDLHCGTHIDAPLHFLPDGASIDEVDLGACIGPVEVVDARGAPQINSALLARVVMPDTERLLLKTDNSTLWARPDFAAEFVGLTVDGAEWIAAAGLRLVGNDYLSIQPLGGDPRTHTVLMEADVVILEGVNLTAVEPGRYELICLPMRIAGAEASPVRAVLRTVDEASV